MTDWPAVTVIDREPAAAPGVPHTSKTASASAHVESMLAMWVCILVRAGDSRRRRVRTLPVYAHLTLSPGRFHRRTLRRGCTAWTWGMSKEDDDAAPQPPPPPHSGGPYHHRPGDPDAVATGSLRHGRAAQDSGRGGYAGDGGPLPTVSLPNWRGPSGEPR